MRQFITIALNTFMEILTSMLSSPGIDMEVSVQVLVKETPSEEGSHPS